MTDVKWIKIVTDIFDDEKMLLIDSYPERDALIVIWFKLLCLAGKQNNGGVFMINDRIPYTDEMLSVIFRRPVNTIRLALSVFEQYGMIEIIDNVITIPNWEKHQSLEELERKKENRSERNKRYYEKKKQALIESKDNKTSYKTDEDSDLRCLKTPLDKIREDKEYIVPKGTLVQNDSVSNAEAEFEVVEDEELDELLASVVKKHEKSILSKQQKTRFEKFYELYPKKQGRQNAEKVWKKLNPSEEETNTILIGLKNAIEHDSRFREQRFTPMPATWLNAGSWDDEYQEDIPQQLQYQKKPKQKIDDEHSFDADDFLDAAIKRSNRT